MATNAAVNQENPPATQTVLTVRRVEIPPRAVSLEASIQIEHTLLLKRVIFFSIFMDLFTILLLLFVKKVVSLTSLLIVIYGYLIYYILETMVRLKQPRRTDWKAREDLLKAMNAGNGIIFLIFVQLNISNIFKGTMVACIPFVIAFGMYLKYSKAPYQFKTFEVLINIAYGLQILMICAKIQGIINWDWLFTFSLFLMYLGVSVVHFFTLAFTLLTLGFYTLFRLSINFTMERRIRVIGTIWHFLYFGLGVTLFIMLLGVANAYSSGSVSNKVILEISAYFGICVSSLLMIVTFLFPRKLIQYLAIYYRLTQIHLEQMNNSARRNVEINASPEGERKSGYFSIISPTYFQPLQKGSLLKDSLNITRIRQMLRSLKFGGIIFENENTDRKAKDKNAYLQELRNSKVKLDQVLDQRSPLRITALKKKSSEEVCTFKVQPESKSLDDLKDNVEPNMKLQFSANDLDIVTRPEKSSLSKMNKGGNEENNCYICCEKPTNAILMSCGHGGICYDCAVTTIKKIGACMECRGDVDYIYKVEPNSKFADIIKAVEINKVSKK